MQQRLFQQNRLEAAVGLRLLERRSGTGFRCRTREGPLFSLHCKKCSVVRSVIKVPSFPSHDGKRRSGLSAQRSFAFPISKLRRERPLSEIGSCYFALAAKVWNPPVVTNCCDGRIGHDGLKPAASRSLAAIYCVRIKSNREIAPNDALEGVSEIFAFSKFAYL